MDEIWRDIDGFSKYQVSRFGEIRNKESGKLLKPQVSVDGYLRVGLRTDEGQAASRMVHKLVAEAFVQNPKPQENNIVNHIDQNRQNANADNLEWVSAKGNANHNDRNERISLSREIPINEFDRNGKYLRTWKSESRIGKYYNVSKDTVSHAMAFQTFVKGRYFRKWNGSVHDIDLSNRICKSELADYSVFGEINSDDLFQAQTFDDKYEEIRAREMSHEGVTLPIMKADMAFLEEYAHRLERVSRKKTSKEVQSRNNSISNDNFSFGQKRAYSTLKEPILALIQKNKIDYVDNRGKGGALWIVGGKELSYIVEQAKLHGFFFCFSNKGGSATKNRPGWWAK